MFEPNDVIDDLPLPTARASLKRAMVENERLRCAAWAAWKELNTIRARDGIPYCYDGTPSSVTEEYFSQVVDELSDVLGEDAKPWPAKRWLEQDGSLPFTNRT